MNENRTRLKGLPDGKPEQHAVGALEGSVQGKTGSRTRANVSIVRCSTRALDPDNLRGSVKAILDCLRNCGLITDDTEEAITLDVSQTKAANRKDHKTLITIEYETVPRRKS